MTTDSKPITFGILESIEATSGGRIPARRKLQWRSVALNTLGWLGLAGLAILTIAKSC